MLPNIPGLEQVQEIGRTANVIGYTAVRQGRELVLEVLKPESPQAEWFFRSSSLATRLGHPAIPAFLETGWQHGQAYRLREYVLGRPVTQLLSDGPLAEERLVAFTRAVASGLQAMHQRGFTHGLLFLDEFRIDRSGVIRYLSTGECLPWLHPWPEALRPHYRDPSWTPADSTAALDLYALGRMLVDLSVGYPVTNPALEQLPVSSAFRHLISALLEPVARRPSAATVLDALLRLDDWQATVRLGQPLPPLPPAGPLEVHPFPLSGRGRELARLVAWQEQSRREPVEGVLVGPRGSGRARLLEELRRGSTLVGSALTLTKCETPPDDGRPALLLEPLGAEAARQLAAAFLNGRLPESLAARLGERSWWPGELLEQLEHWCCQAELRPWWGRWVMDAHDESASPSSAAPSLPSANSLDARHLERFVHCLRELQQASQDPVDLLQSLLSAIERVIPFAVGAAWLVGPAGLLQVAGTPTPEVPELLRLALEQNHPRHEPGPPGSLALPLVEGEERLGGCLITRGNLFTGEEIELAERLSAQVRLDLRRARLFGEQNRLLELTRHRFLTAQIRPHFLFNALNTLAALIVGDPEQAELLTLDMAEFLRTTFADRPDRVTLLEEVQLAQVYLRLEKARFGERLKFELELAPGAQSLLLPTLTLQPLVENAVRHGLTTRAQGGTLSLRVAPTDGGFLVGIEDDGVGFDPERVRPAGTGVGLNNVRERVLALYGEECQWQVRSAPGQGTRITFRIPDS